jgi:NAD(P)-dependent dehydrogenase (short-subunit alcohol dehydrogenase family)
VVAVVSGGNRGIGLEVCRQLAGRGDRVVLGSRDPAKGEAAARELAGEGLEVMARQLDVADPVDSALGRVDALVNNAAIHYDSGQSGAGADLEIVTEALETNLLGAWRMCQAFLPMLRRGGHGRIVNVSSGAGSISEMGAGAPAYSVSKAALNAMTRILAAELERERILVNAICPGWTATEMGSWGGRPVTDGAAGIVWAATLPDDGPRGGFFRDGEPLGW